MYVPLQFKINVKVKFNFKGILVVSLLSVGAPFLFLDVHLQWTWGQRPRNMILPWKWTQWICFPCAGQQRVNLFNTATQIAVYHLKYRVQSEEKGHGSLYFGGKRTIFFIIFSANKPFIKRQNWKLSAFSSWGLFYFISTTWEKERRPSGWSTATVHRLPLSSDTVPIVETIESHFFLCVELEYFKILLSRLSGFMKLTCCFGQLLKEANYMRLSAQSNLSSKDLFYFIPLIHHFPPREQARQYAHCLGVMLEMLPKGLAHDWHTFFHWNIT